jgi:hypothetical protein
VILLVDRVGRVETRIVGRVLLAEIVLILLIGSSGFTSETIVVPDQYPTIQAAVDAAQHGDIVHVRAGLYYENIEIPPRITNLSLMGENPASTVIDGGGTGACIHILGYASGQQSTGLVEGFTLRNSGEYCALCVRTHGNGVWTIRGNTIRDNPWNGITTSDGGLITGNIFTGISGCAIYAGDHASVTIAGNTMCYCSQGIDTSHRVAGLKIHHNVIAYCDNGIEIDTTSSEASECSLWCNVLWEIHDRFEYRGCEAGEGDFRANPLFCDAVNGNFGLCDNSPCAPAINQDCGLIGALDVSCDCRPELRLGILEDPYLCRFLDIYVVASEPLDSSSIELEINGRSVAVGLVDSAEQVWAAEYTLPLSGGTISIVASASDMSGNVTTVEGGFSCAYLSALKGGSVGSPDGKVALSVPGGVLPEDTHLLIVPRQYDGHALGAEGIPTDRHGFWEIMTMPGEPCAYQIGTEAMLLNGDAYLEFRFSDSDLPPEASLERLYVQHVGVGPVESVVDPLTSTLYATIGSLGAFRLAYGAEGFSRIADPNMLEVNQPYPNPFRTLTVMSFKVESKQRVRASVYDVVGRMVTRLYDRDAFPGVHNIIWHAGDTDDKEVSSGVYFVRFETEEALITRKLLLVR